MWPFPVCQPQVALYRLQSGGMQPVYIRVPTPDCAFFYGILQIEIKLYVNEVQWITTERKEMYVIKRVLCDFKPHHNQSPVMSSTLLNGP